MNRTVRACVSAGFLGVFTMGASSPAQAAIASLDKAYLFSNWTAPTVGSVPAFSFMGTDGVQLNLTGTQVTGVSDIGPLDFDIIQALTYAAHTNTINSGEPGPTATRVNSEVGTWDDTGIVNDGSADAALNIDYRNNAEVVFNPVGSPGYTALIIAEDAAFDPLGLSLCSNATCASRQTIISSFSTAAVNAILGRSDFVAGDNSDAAEMDQAYLFLFNSPIDAFTAVKELTNPGGAKLEVDFIGAGTVVPIPGAAWLFGTGLVALAGFVRRRANSA